MFESLLEIIESMVIKENTAAMGGGGVPYV